MKKIMKQLEQALKALGSKRRLEIMNFLKSAKEAPVWLVSEKIDLSYRTTSKHLQILEKAGILKREQRRVEAFYKIVKNKSLVVSAVLNSL